jgi:hypothetical protein
MSSSANVDWILIEAIIQIIPANLPSNQSTKSSHDPVKIDESYIKQILKIENQEEIFSRFASESTVIRAMVFDSWQPKV